MVVVKGFLDLGVSKGVDLATVVITGTKSLNEDWVEEAAGGAVDVSKG